MVQGTGPVLPRLPGRLRCVEHGGGVRAGRRADDLAGQPAPTVLRPGLPWPITAVPAAGHQHCLRLRQVRGPVRVCVS